MEPIATVEQATEVIRARVEACGGEVWGTPTRNDDDGEWHAVIALRPWGPLVVMGFRLKAVPGSTKEDE
jgi:hypothetical protein